MTLVLSNSVVLVTPPFRAWADSSGAHSSPGGHPHFHPACCSGQTHLRVVASGASPAFSCFPATRKLVQLGLCLLSAPEMVKGDPIGSATDIWGAGVLTYIM